MANYIYIKEEKLRNALRASGDEAYEEFARLLGRAEVSERKLQQKYVPNYYRINARIFDFLMMDPQKELQKTAHQMVGFLARLYRETGMSSFQKYIAAEDELLMLREIGDMVGIYQEDDVEEK